MTRPTYTGRGLWPVAVILLLTSVTSCLPRVEFGALTGGWG